MLSTEPLAPLMQLANETCLLAGTRLSRRFVLVLHLPEGLLGGLGLLLACGGDGHDRVLGGRNGPLLYSRETWLLLLALKSVQFGHDFHLISIFLDKQHVSDTGIRFSSEELLHGFHNDFASSSDREPKIARGEEWHGQRREITVIGRLQRSDYGLGQIAIQLQLFCFCGLRLPAEPGTKRGTAISRLNLLLSS